MKNTSFKGTPGLWAWKGLFRRWAGGPHVPHCAGIQAVVRSGWKVGRGTKKIRGVIPRETAPVNLRLAGPAIKELTAAASAHTTQSILKAIPRLPWVLMCADKAVYLKGLDSDKCLPAKI